MAKIYFEKLSALVKQLNIAEESTSEIEVKHFFSGAALYINGSIFVSWSPGGLAFKLSDSDVENLIQSKAAIPLKYFPNGYVKKGYALFENPDEKKIEFWIKYFKLAAKLV